MSTQAPAPAPPPRTNTLLAVILGVLILLVILVGFGVFVASRFLSQTSIVTQGHGPNQSVDIQSPLGDLHVRGQGDDAQLNIQSPFGSLRVNPKPDLTQLDMSIFPGAQPVRTRADSPFRGSNASVDGIQLHDGDHTAAQVWLQHGSDALRINVAEFRTSATPAQVLSFYQRQLNRFGPLTQKQDGSTRSLQVKLASDNIRAVEIRPGRDGTHFVLVRVESSALAR